MTIDPQKAVERLQKQYKNQNEYIKNNYKRVSITIKKEVFEKLTEKYGPKFSINGYINKLVLEDLERLEDESGSAELPDFMKD